MKQMKTPTTRIIALLLALVLLIGTAATVSAASYSAGQSVTVYHDFATYFKLKERDAAGFPWMATAYLVAGEGSLTVPSGASWVYCIDYSHSASGGTFTATDLLNTGAWNNLSQAARRGITHATIYGCPNNGASNIYSYAATQLIIWEYQLGQRTNPSQNVSYFSATLNQNSTLRSYYNSILTTMAQHYSPPSFSGSSVTLRGYGRENGVTVTDTSGQLANDTWKITSSNPGFVIEQNGNNLLIYANSTVTSGTTTSLQLQRNLKVTTGNAVGITVGSQQSIIGVPPDPVVAALTVKMDAAGSLTIQKTSDTNDVSDYCFKIYSYVDMRSWYGKSDSTGKVFETDSSYSASGTKTYTFDGMTDGTYTFLEALSQKGKDQVFPDSWTITVKNGSTTKFEHTYTASDFTRDANGDCRLENIAITGLTGGGVMTMTIHNAPETGDLEIVKTSTDGVVEGISFRVEQYEAEGGIGWWEKGTYETNADGRISITGMNVGTKLRVTEIVPDGYECTSDNPQEITLQRGTNRLTFSNKPLSSLVIVKTSPDGNVEGIEFQVAKWNGRMFYPVVSYFTDEEGRINVPDTIYGSKYQIREVVPEGYTCLSENPQEITLTVGENTVTFENEPTANLLIQKTSEDGAVKGIEFTIEWQQGKRYTTLGTFTTDSKGRINFPDIEVGAVYRVTEVVPEGYVAEEQSQTFTAVSGTNTVTFSNRLIRGSLRIVKTDKGTETPLQGAGYRVFNAAGKEVASGYTDQNGEVRFENLAYGEYTYQEFAAPEGFVLDDTVYSFSILQDGVEIAKQHDNEAKQGSITVYKTDEAGRPLSGVTFLLEFSVNDGETWSAVAPRSEDSSVIAGYCSSEGLNAGKLTTGSDGYAVYSGLCIDTQLGEVLYRVTEIATKDGYRLLSGYVFEGSLSEGVEINVSFTVVNQPEYKIPVTGSSGFTVSVIAFVFASVVAAASLFLFRKKKTGQ